MKEKVKYANCWEDTDLLLSTTRLPKGCNIFSIASAGDNTLALLTTTPKSIMAVDVNPAQLYLCELKAAAFSELSYNQLLEFFWGMSGALGYYNSLNKQLSPACKRFWDSNNKAIGKGILHFGKFENYFRFFRSYILPVIHSKRNIERLLAYKSASAQADFYTNSWNTGLWQFMFKLFFSKFILGRFGRTKTYFNHVEVDVGNYIYEQTAKHLCSIECQNNYFVHHIFQGHFNTFLPFYLRAENYGSIKQNLSSLSLCLGTAQEFLSVKCDYDFCNFSNIFEYMSLNEFATFHDSLAQNLPIGSIIAYWNLMVDRVFSTSFSATFTPFSAPNVHLVDKGFFYKRFVTEIKK